MNLKSELTKLIAFAPVTSDPDANQALLDYEAKLFSDIGMKITRGSIGNHPYLIAGTRSTARARIVLQAHVDVVPGSPDLFRAKYQGSRLYGRGSYDMLFAAASFNKLLLDLSKTGKLADLDLAVMLTSDEEIGGEEGVGKLIDRFDADVCFLPDAGNDTKLSVSAKGVLELSLKLKGISGHGSRPWITRSPFLSIPAVLDVLSGTFDNTNRLGTTCSVTMLNGGEVTNQVPGEAEMILDIRFAPEDDPVVIEKNLRQKLKGLDIEIRRLEIADAYKTEASNPYITQYLDDCMAVTGKRLGFMQSAGSSDARFFTAKGIPVIMCRPKGGDLHGDNEFVDLLDLELFHEVLERYVLRLGNTV